MVKEKDGSLTTFAKARGFFLKDKLAGAEVNASTMAELVRSYVNLGDSESKVVPQFNIKIEGKTKRLYSETSLKVFRNDIYNKRVPFIGGAHPSPVTMPFGYNRDMLQRRNIKFIE